MCPTAATHTATRDAVMATRTGSLTAYTVTSDRDANYAVLGPVPGNPDAVYVAGWRHGNLAVVTRTGSVPVRGKGPQVRVRIAFARDTGDQAGTLAFDEGSIGGVAPRVLFA